MKDRKETQITKQREKIIHTYNDILYIIEDTPS